MTQFKDFILSLATWPVMTCELRVVHINNWAGS